MGRSGGSGRTVRSLGAPTLGQTVQCQHPERCDLARKAHEKATSWTGEGLHLNEETHGKIC